MVTGVDGAFKTTIRIGERVVRVSDRTREHLGWSDRGVVMMRKRFLADLEAVAAGKDPKAVLRDEENNKRMALPCMSEQRHLPPDVIPEPLAEQPQTILDEMEQLWAQFS